MKNPAGLRTCRIAAGTCMALIAALVRTGGKKDASKIIAARAAVANASAG